jgi:hypothetical protein
VTARIGGRMSERESRIRTTLVVYFPMFIATLSLVTSIYNGFLNSKFVDLVQNNITRVEYMKTCKEIIDAYFQVKFHAGLIANATPPAVNTSAQADAVNAVNKFAALATYLANLRNENVRQRYTDLSRALDKIVADARQTPAGGLDRAFEPADRLFAEMNDDCVKSAKAALR